jgi:hypothetical protein
MYNNAKIIGPSSIWQARADIADGELEQSQFLLREANRVKYG